MSQNYFPGFNGPDYVPELDHKRLTNQIDKIRNLMLSSEWLTLREISNKLDYSEASISAQLRHLRKSRFGSYIVSKRRRGDRSGGLFEYMVSERVLVTE